MSETMSEQIELRPDPAPPAPIELADGSAAEGAHDRYLDALHDLVQDAAQAERMHLLADVLAWTIARLAVGCGQAATADMLAKIGKYMGALEEQRRAKQELEAAREEGRLVN